jgi:hypothetical protein
MHLEDRACKWKSVEYNFFIHEIVVSMQDAIHKGDLLFSPSSLLQFRLKIPFIIGKMEFSRKKVGVTLF